ncbi:MAG: anti-sigma factor family protein [Anaerolineales bacterium]
MLAHPDLLRMIENRLTPAERERVEAHLAVCPQCRAKLAETLELVDRLEAIPAALRAVTGRTERLWPAIWNRLQRPAARPRRRRPTWQMTLGMSLATLCLVLSSTLPAGVANSPSAPSGEAPHPSLAATPATSLPANLPHPGAALSGTQLFSTTAPRPVQTPLPGPTS